MREPNGSCLALLLGRLALALLRPRRRARPSSARRLRAAAAVTLTALRETLPPREASARLLELVGRLVDRLQVALVLVLAAGRRDVRVPALGHPPARELHRPLVEGRLELQQQDRLLDVEDRRHDRLRVARRRAARGVYPPPLDVRPVHLHHAPPVAVFPPDKEVLKDVSLAFYPGAKIGVLGLQRRRQVDAAADHGGRSTPSSAATRSSRPARRSACSSRSPQLDQAKDVRGNVEDGVAELRAPARPLQRAVGELLRRDRRRVRAPAGADRRRRRLEPRHDARHGDGRAAAAAGRRRRDEALRRRAPPRRALPAAAARSPTCCCSTSRPTTSTPSRSPGSSATSPTTRARSSRHPRPLLPRQRRRLDPRARPRPRDPLRGQLLSGWLEQKQAAPRAGGARGRARAAHDRAGARVGADERLRAAARSPRRA